MMKSITKNHLEKRRSGVGMFRTELARRAGISATHVRYLETGKSLPSLATAKRIAEALHCDVDDLWTFNNED